MVQMQRLEGFYWVGETGGYARAARAFPYPITQPAVHQQVKKLERELDVTLFERVGKDRMQLTPAGVHLHRFIAPFFRDLPAVARAVQTGTYGGKLSIHAEPLLLRQLLPAWLKRIQRKRPDIQVDLREYTDVSVEDLRCGAADLLVTYLPNPDDDIASIEVGVLHPFLVLPRDHPLAGRSRLSITDLADEPFIAYNEDQLPHGLQMKALLAHGVHPTRIITTSSADSILGFVESGLGYSLVPSLSETGPKSRGIVARPLGAPKMTFPVVAAWRKDAPENPLLDTALECAPA
jgi:DNA-binding transcriptional LysR family regulator